MRTFLLAFGLACPFFLAAQENHVQIALQPWAAGISEPVCIAHAQDSRLFVLERAGVVRVVMDSMQVLPTPFLDIAAQVNSNGGEQGLLGMAFDPGYAGNGFFYLYYIHGSGAGTSRISRFQVTADSNVADPASEVVLYSVQQPFTNHNGGCLQFGPDGYLYCGFGDGGSGNDPNGNGQNMATPLGKMIRIDVSQHNSTYTIPPDNPFAAAQDTLPEIWASGLRNPWRWSFDRQTGDVWIGDVGQNAWEEVDFRPAGDLSGPNFGWRCREGSVATPGVPQAGCGPASAYQGPVAVFGHFGQGWCSVVGGYVYRGSAYPRLQGKYIFTDYCAGDFIAFGENYALDTLLATDHAGWFSAFGENAQGELFVTDMTNSRILKITDACPMPPPVISLNDGILASTPAQAWQWYLDGQLISGATDITFEPLVNGTYRVRASFTGGCMLFSDSLSITTAGIHQAGLPAMEIFPQPATGVLMVSADDLARPAYMVQLRDAVGRVVLRLQWPASEPLLSIDVSGLAPGTYVLSGVGGQAHRWTRLVSVVH